MKKKEEYRRRDAHDGANLKPRDQHRLYSSDQCDEQKLLLLLQK